MAGIREASCVVRASVGITVYGHALPYRHSVHTSHVDSDPLYSVWYVGTAIRACDLPECVLAEIVLYLVHEYPDRRFRWGCDSSNRPVLLYFRIFVAHGSNAGS